MQENLKQEEGYTLIELIAVVALLAVVSAFFVSRFSFSSEWAVRDSITQFANTVEYLKIDSRARQVKYLVEINLKSNSYKVWQVVTPLANTTQNVDLLSGFRTNEEALRKQEQESKKAMENLSSNYELEAKNEGMPLEDQFYAIAYASNDDQGLRIPPLDSPSLVEPKYFSPELKIVDYQLASINQLENSNNDLISIPIYPGMSGTPFTITFQSNTKSVRLTSKSGFKGLLYETL